jgi:hypothetical protein
MLGDILVVLAIAGPPIIAWIVIDYRSKRKGN